MKLPQIITNLNETDAYKFSMMQAIYHQFNGDRVVWSFKCRNPEVKFTPEMIAEIRAQVDAYCNLTFRSTDLILLKDKLPWLKDDFIDFLKLWHPVRKEILINEGNIRAYNDCGLAIEAHGTWLNTSMYEIAILAIVSEVYFAFKYGEGAKDTEVMEKTFEKIAGIESGKYDLGAWSEFGLRRRYSGKTQDMIIKAFVDKKVKGFVGTSNVALAIKYGVKAVGTQAHEFIMAVGQGHHEYNPAYSNLFALKSWVKEYQTDNGIALTDTITTDCFLRDFNKHYAAVFSGVRHDSADPYAWGEKMIQHYVNLGIDPTTKTLLFSDSLDFEKATNLKKYFEGRAKVAFGIGTNISCPLDGASLNIVMKLTEVNGSPVAKISDAPGKSMCKDNAYVDYLNRCIDWRIAHER